MNRLILASGNVFDGNKFIGCKDILIEDGRIVEISGQIDLECDRIDMKGKYVCPGFIDIHIHGACGYDFTNANPDGLKRICNFLAMHGVTSILATALTAGNEKIRTCLRQIKDYKSGKPTGTNILGIHLEGPFINPKKKGGMNEQYVQKPSIKSYEDMVLGYEDIIKSVTLAPELPGAKELIEYLRVKNIYISIGHSIAAYDQVIDAVNSGANRATHIFNGMDALNNREPGTVGGLLDCKDVYAEMIVDLKHLHPAIIRLIMKAKGFDKSISISDAIEAAGQGDGEYDIGGNIVVVKDGAGRLKDSQTLCGCTTILDQSLRNLAAIGIELEDALKTVTSNPAKAIGVDGLKGSIKVGADADIAVLDKNLEVFTTIINGNQISY